VKNRNIVAALTAAVLSVPVAAHAFCGFYVSGASDQMFNNATEVVLMRSGTRTVLSMQNNYQGPAQDFAMVIPVPVVLHEGDVKTLPKETLQKVDTMGAPRLVEYWEKDPCQPEPPPVMYEMASVAPMAPTNAAAGAGSYGVKIEAQFVVGEYQIVILSAKDSTGLDSWLRDTGYKIPDGAEKLLRPYVEGGSKFFVAKVDPNKVKFVDGQVALSPLRFNYDSEDFSLPIRLGLANSNGTQDLIVNILAPDRYEVANYKNVTIPTNFDVKDEVRKRFGEFYAALFDRTLEKTPGAVITEYAWQAMSCDPCPGPNLDYHDMATLGADVVPDGAGGNFTMTRLHARYGKTDVPNDLVFKKALPIVGGREERNEQGTLEHGASSSSYNNFQGRYAIRHAWTGPMACTNPQRGRWSGEPPQGSQIADQGIMAATNLAFAPRGKIQLPNMVAQAVPELGVVPGEPLPGGAGFHDKQGCGCQSSGDASGFALGALGLLAFLRRKKHA
jgi:MYXO-CTERM domain-containing protein